jgi:hypothetical protein
MYARTYIQVYSTTGSTGTRLGVLRFVILEYSTEYQVSRYSDNYQIYYCSCFTSKSGYVIL